MSKTNTHEDAVLNTARGVALAAWTPYVALFTGDPGEAGSVAAECAAVDYAREAAVFAAPSGGSMANSTAVDYGIATSDWGNLTHFGVMDAVSGGTMRYKGALTTAKHPTNGDPVSFAIGALVISED